MAREIESAKFPEAKVVDADIGVATNREGKTLTASVPDQTGDTTIDLSGTNGLEENEYGMLVGADGYEIGRVKSVNAAQDEATITRGEDGTTERSFEENDSFVPIVPALTINQLRAETVAMQDWMGADGDTWTMDRNIVLQPSTTDGTYPLTIDVLSGHSDPEPFINFRRSTDGGTSYSSVGSIDYDPTNDQLELSNIELVMAGSAHLLFEDDQELRFGTEPKDYWMTYNSGSTRWEFRSTDVDGGGSDGLLAHVDDGADALTLYGDLLTDTDDSSSLGSTSAGWANVYLADDAPVQYGADQDWLVQYDSANSWWELSDGTNDAIRVADTSLDVAVQTGSLDIASGNLDIGGVTLFENDRDFAVDLIPNADATLDVGSASRTLADFHSQTGTFYQGLVVNEDGGSNDFRVESANVDPMLEVTGAQDQVNVHTSFNADWGALNVGVRDASAASEVDMVATLADSTDSADIQGTNTDVWGVRVGNPTINSAGGATTVTDSAALYVPGPIQAGTDVTITNQYVALMEDGSGNKLFRFSSGGGFGIGNQGSGADPFLSSNSSSKRVLVEDELEVNNVGSGSNPFFKADHIGRTLSLTGNLRPPADDTRSLGLTGSRYSEAHATQFMVEASSGDANPVVQVDSDGVKFGPGGGSGLDWLIKRSSGDLLDLRDAADTTFKTFRADDLRAVSQFSATGGRSPSFEARDTSDNLVTVATLNRASTPTFDLDQARLPDTGTLHVGTDHDVTLTWDDTNNHVRHEGDTYTHLLTPTDVSTDGGTKNSPTLTLRAKHDSDTSTSVTSSATDYTVEFVSQVTSGTQTGHVRHQVAGTEALRLQDNADVNAPQGLLVGGTGKPQEGLDIISGGLTTLQTRSTAADSDNTAIGRLNFQADNMGGDLAVIQGRSQGTTSGNRGGELVFFTKPDGAGITERARFDNAGQFGLGTSAPNFRYHQSGGTYAHLGVQESSPTTGDMDNQALIFWLDDGNNELEIVVKNSSGTVKTGTVAVS